MLRDILSAGIGRRLAVRRLQPAARYIADADKPEGVRDLRCLLVEEVLSAVGDLGMDCLGATLLAGTLSRGEVRLRTWRTSGNSRSWRPSKGRLSG